MDDALTTARANFTTARTELATAREDLARRPNLEKLQRLVTYLAARIEDTKLRRDMSDSFREQLADLIRLIALERYSWPVLKRRMYLRTLRRGF